MDSCDVLIVGGGPAGSSCAWGLRNSGLDVAIIDKQVFPRDKVCGGWITPEVIAALEIDAAEYGVDRVLQPITRFRTGCIGSHSVQEIGYSGEPVSYGIRRREFDHYLLQRCGARVHEGVGFSSLERSGQHGGDIWIVNGNIRTRMVVGAGGHFCPVARHFGSKRTATAVVAQEAEFEVNGPCPVEGTRPELYFCPDMKGYGWCFRKGNYLNIGLGRADAHGLPEQAGEFVKFLGVETPAMRGHAYFLYGTSQRTISGDGFLLIGDSAGLAYPQSGEGILPAIEAGLFAAEAIQGGEPYAPRIERRFGGTNWLTGVGRALPPWMLQAAASRLMNTQWFVRDFVLDRWFLHR